MPDPPADALYEHVGETLIPLLRSHLPHTVVILGTILANTAAIRATKGVSDQYALPPVFASFSPRSDDGDITLDYLRSVGVGEFDWLLTVALPSPSEQIRFYHSLVAAGPTERTAGLSRANELVRLALAEMKRRYPDQPVVGHTHELFERMVRDLTGSPLRHRTYTYVAPQWGFGRTLLDVDNDRSQGRNSSLVVGSGHPDDAQLIYSTNPYRLPEYYAARAPFTTVLRPAPSASSLHASSMQPPVAWVMTHGDGSLGALWTQPAFRRRGLARILLRTHLADQAQHGLPGFCYVEADNAASVALWESLGWGRMPWVSYWMYVTSKTGHEIG